MATWFPEFGLTYWQLGLPVYVISMLTGHTDIKPTMPKGFKNYTGKPVTVSLK